MTSYRTASVTLTNANTNYNLGVLLQALDPNFPLHGREVSLQTSSSVAGTVRVGDGTVSGTSCGYELPNTAPPRVYRNDISSVPLSMFTLRGSVGAMVVNVEVCQ